MPWGKGMVIDEVSISSKYHEPTIQLLEFDNGDKLLRFCSYSHGRFSRSPLMIDEKDLRHLGKAAAKSKQIRKLISKLSEWNYTLHGLALVSCPSLGPVQAQQFVSIRPSDTWNNKRG